MSLQSNEVIAFRSRARYASIWDRLNWLIKCKPEATKTLVKLPLGLRIVRTSGGKLQLIVSDLDVAWVIRDGRLLSNQEFTGNEENPISLLERINKAYGAAMVKHGPHVNGVLENLGAPLHNLRDIVYVIGADGYLGAGPMLDMLERYAPA